MKCKDTATPTTEGNNTLANTITVFGGLNCGEPTYGN